ncbi:MAG TPA: TetR/AcrR family transcriptional regulator [Solirubrobacteraceae bacterium]|nr:TetR/AcrR family transcriptional regulator [Solirubrobacteraceae bacterium]
MKDDEAPRSPNATDHECRGDRSLRKDAELNRQRLLAAAAEVFAQQGLGATLHDVAAHAGVGVGTAYRNFANKGELIDEFFRERIDEVVAHAKNALQIPDAWQGLTTFLEHSLRMQYENRGLKDMLTNPHLGPARADESPDRIAPLIDALISRAKSQGILRPDFESSDLILIQVALAALMDSNVRRVQPDLYRRYLTMFLDGIRTDQGAISELPVPALSNQETHAIMTRARNADASSVGLEAGGRASLGQAWERPPDKRRR